MEKDELPDDAAVREVLEETGVDVELVGERHEDIVDLVQTTQARRRAVGEHRAGAPAHRLDLLRETTRLDGDPR